MSRKRSAGNGDGSVYRVRGRNLWAASVTKRTANGGSKRVVQYAKTRSEALEKRRKMLLSSPMASVGTGKITVATAVGRYLAQCDKRPTTLSRYRSLAENHIVPLLGAALVSQLTAGQIVEAMETMRTKGQSASSRAQSLTVIRQALEQSIREGVIAVNPATGIKRPRPDHFEHQVWTLEQCRAFLACPACKAHQHFPIFAVAIGGGMRIGEIFALRLEDFDPESAIVRIRRSVSEVEGEFHVGPPKTEAGNRSIVLPEFTAAIVRDHLAKRIASGAKHDDLLFPARGGQFVRRNRLGRILTRLCGTAGVPRVRIHDLRHTSISFLLASGENPKVVQERSGHGDIRVTLSTYGHVLPGGQAGAAKKLGDMFDANGTE